MMRLLPLLLSTLLLMDLGSIGDDALAPTRDKLISSAELLADVEFLQSIYEAAHPGLYRYNTRTELAANLDALRSEFSRDRTLADAYLEFSRFLATLRCGHSYANFFNQPKATAKALFAGKNRVPFTFGWIDGRLIVTRDLDDPDRLRPGTEIVSIEGVPVGEIRDRLMTIARADGSNDAKRVAYLEVRGTSRLEAFDVYLPLFYPTIKERMELVVRQPGATVTSSLVVSAHDFAQREALEKESQGIAEGSDRPDWEFRMLDDSTAYLRMRGWALYNSNWDWRTFLNKGIDELVDRDIAALIVDIRGNEGGLDVGNVLIERIAERPIGGGDLARYTRYRKLPEKFYPQISTWDDSFKDWGIAAREDESGFFRLTKYDEPDGAEIRPRGRRYLGRLVVLTDAVNSSATYQFAKLIKENGLGTLVGQTTGGNQRGINGGAFFFVMLPNSRIEVDLPLIASFPCGPRPDGTTIPFSTVPDAGIEPDVRVGRTAEAVAAGVDSELEAAREWLRSAR